jgi:hypothetical protein
LLILGKGKKIGSSYHLAIREDAKLIRINITGDMRGDEEKNNSYQFWFSDDSISKVTPKMLRAVVSRNVQPDG